MPIASHHRRERGKGGHASKRRTLLGRALPPAHYEVQSAFGDSAVGGDTALDSMQRCTCSSDRPSLTPSRWTKTVAPGSRLGIYPGRCPATANATVQPCTSESHLASSGPA